MKSKKKLSFNMEELDFNEAEDEGFIEGEVNFGTPIATFSFGESFEQPAPLISNANSFNNPQKGLGLTPTIDGEAFSIKRGYQFRPSTLRKLVELKSKHSDVNAYLNTILDEAINFYYNYVISKNNS
ncbi:hypothetical protein NBE98_03390 [Clostridium swellfunianum]|uniref:hypothetical protein n=1 Tax=Clostridium swellfunianum TaxID=1367462 RepID=UPI00202F1F8A|nr:hypothetical protein [Clostridium swellfunianum]MCM0647420.1 hypothetical protein [Clostridium swellfunianum]